MALVKLNALADNVSGSIGKLTFSRTKGGLSVRTKAGGNPYLSPIPSQWLGYINIALAEWKNLSEAKRKEWNFAALQEPYQSRIGEKKILSGVNYFTKINSYRTAIFQPILTTPPKKVVMSPITNFRVTEMKQLDYVLKWDGPKDLETYYYFLKASLPKSSGIMSNDRYGEIVINFLFNNVENTINAATPYQSIYGMPAVGKKIFFQITPIHVATGRRLYPLNTSAIIEPY